MAHISEITGKYSQVIAKAALMAGGFAVAETETDESYDFVARKENDEKWRTFQCKTIRQRNDRNGELVVYATNGKGEPYTKENADYLIGVWAPDGEQPRVFYFENRGLREYWTTEANVSKRWVELPVAFNRNVLAEAGGESA